ncbi:MAG: sugar phosphate nucleotidyltransferase [Candidatus Omnitrophica bacterium]|nr:sugar phosphate nucleotidyltransferase [Candidatus Omnitrophota bacterium]MDD5352873.1 sugar phosphate nucleotidyltransferase [Candidatus Omnitrophota bacterium]MDD5550472.1 sugar phosphate nucleotidyltransferase [Candidatus Omnitrophota bacterium]
MKDFITIILAAGEGTRMNSDVPKVLHEICGRPMIDYVIDSVANARLKKICVVLNKEHTAVLDYINARKNKYIKAVFQKKPQGTADAVMSANKFLSKAKANVLILCADTPLIKTQTLQQLVNHHKDRNASCTMLTSFLDNPSGFGRIVRDEYSKVRCIIEEMDASFSQKQIREINSGIYCFNSVDLLQALNEVGLNAKKKEYYLTDVIEILYKNNKRIETCVSSNPEEALGINSRLELSHANEIMRMRIIEEFLKNGVSVLDPKTTFINYGVSIGKETAIYPFTVIQSGVKIGSKCSIGPFCHLREGTVIKDNSVVGNFTEIVRSQLGEGTYFKHLGYLGDTSVGKGVNIGAGMTIANFDGKNKNRTVIGDKAFIGCDTVIVAPAKIGKSAVTGAGAVITKGSNIKNNSVVVGVPAKPLVKAVVKVIKKSKAKKTKKKK